MAHRSGDVAVVRSVCRPQAKAGQKNILMVNEDDASAADNDEDGDLPQCKIKRNYSCNLCPFFSQNPRSFLYHSRDVHFDRIKIYECSQCLYASKHSQKLQRHINMIHVNSKSRIKRVPKSTKVDKKKEQKPAKGKREEANQSTSTAQKDENRGNYLPSVSIEECGNEDENDQYMDDGKELKCSICNFTSKNSSLMRRHEKVVHFKKRFLRCTKCSYVTHVKARYTKHVKYHSMPMIKCDLCDFRTPYKWNLDRHYKNHCGSGAFQCAKCNFRADIKQSLTVHEMNHHIPPVGQGAVMVRRRNKVGASETTAMELDMIDKEEQELLRMEREDVELLENEEIEMKEEEGEKIQERRGAGRRNLHHLRNLPSNKRESVNNLQTDFIHPDDVVPRYGQIYVKTLKCKFCNYKAVFGHELSRHEKRIHNYIRPEVRKEKVPGRPPPKLIPLQSKVSSTAPLSPILKIPAVRSASSAVDANVKIEEQNSLNEKSVNEKEFTEMCKKSCLTSSLKDFVSLIGDEEGLKTIPDPQGDIDLECRSLVGTCDDEVKNSEEVNKRKQTDLLKKKNASFFDKLKEKLLTSTSETSNLICDCCGYESKCLSEAVAHQKRHSGGSRSDSEGQQENDIILMGAELSSTRCQHCRQRCKTSTDLINHLKSCKAFGAAYDQQPKLEEGLDVLVKGEDVLDEYVKVEEDSNSMENRVFVWNDIPHMYDNVKEDEEMEENEMAYAEMPYNEEDFDGESTQMYGTVTSKGADNTESGTLVAEIDPRLSLTVKKVFKCPHCSFWASTASRFHVHIVGHLNKKPFECSLCMYRSNWRWDITKHIRLKSARDPSHLEAKVNMTDETGRRNYSKYNKYLTMMKVQEPSAESSGTGRRSKGFEITQGIANENDIIPLPAPPTLTRAPSPGAGYQLPQGVPLRPPPPLKAAHQVALPSACKKTLWKCKKCNFRDSNKDYVLSHVKEHYGNIQSNSPSTQSPEPEDAAEDPSGSSSLFHKSPPFRCGHCHQVSNWKHVIQRHCRLKHNGFVLIELDWKDNSNTKHQPESEMSLDTPVTADISLDTFSCDICPFTTDSEGDLTAHKLNHIDRPGSIFKCTYCPFYVPSKIAVLEHMEVHGIECGVQLSSLKIDNFEPNECNEDFAKNKTNDGPGQQKRYKCRQCPYVSNSKTQFLYHKQFHIPRKAPFKCMYCSYNVSRRHLLHQHLRVHDNSQESQEPVPQKPDSPVDPIPPVEIDTSHMKEIPLVWVFKLGNIQKMYKCRWCPHVNHRKINIQEHEKMHRIIGVNDEETASYRLQCPDCNYVCNNAGVLSSHTKVHLGYFGEIRSLVDPKRSDAEQIQELQNAMRVVEPEVVISVAGDSENDDATKEENKTYEKPPEEGKSNGSGNQNRNSERSRRMLSFCNKCPARFFLRKELRIHSKFHTIKSTFVCPFCSYTARQKPHLLCHYRVHSEEYQYRTEEFLKIYSISSENPRQKTVIVAKSTDVIKGPVYVLENNPSEKGKGSSKSRAKYACNKCPAKFFKSVALRYHLTLHGGAHEHKCKYCDYAVKTYGNLMRHQLVHEKEDQKPVLESKVDSEMTNKGGKVTSTVPSKSESWNRRKTDPQFGSLIQGSPEFIYPTYRKNGKIREKRYKCHKCPSAFEKREQYKIHLSLHGSKQKYSCEKCDYSVKYYANYVQHMKKHQTHEEALKKLKLNETTSEQEIIYHYTKANIQSASETKRNKICNYLEQQTFLLVDRKKVERCDEKKLFRCSYCPYVSNRGDALENHCKRHYFVSGVRSNFKCMFCDYMATQSNFLKEHNKVHFNNCVRHEAEGYLKCDKISLYWVEATADVEDDSKNKVLVFMDKGENVETRFLPPVPPPLTKNDNEGVKIYVNPETGEPDVETDAVEKGHHNDKVNVNENPLPSQAGNMELQKEDLVGMVGGPLEKNIEQDSKSNSKAKKRWRGKNWKCKKCPHAFNKKDQYLRHASLHGSNQKHNCDLCDYSVKFYTNYVQHMKMHQMHEPDKIIHVKKNIKTDHNSPRVTREISSIPETEILLNSIEEVTYYEMDSVSSQVTEKMAVEQYGETDQQYSGVTDVTEMSISSEDVVCQEMKENIVKIGSGVSAFVKYKPNTS